MKPGGNYRWVICGLLFFSVAINYIDRLVIGILKEPLSQALGWSEVDYGNIAAAFSFAYAFGYLIGGRSMDRFGVKHGLPIFVLAWSIAATAHGLVALIGLEEQFSMKYPWFSWTEKGFVWMTLAMPMTARIMSDSASDGREIKSPNAIEASARKPTLTAQRE